MSSVLGTTRCGYRTTRTSWRPTGTRCGGDGPRNGAWPLPVEKASCERAGKVVHSGNMARSASTTGNERIKLPTPDYEADDVLVVRESEQLRALGDDLRSEIVL